MAFRTLKPYPLAMQFRVVERHRGQYASFSLLTMTHRTASPALRSEPALWKTLAKHAPEFTEASIVKSQPEFLVFGHAHAYDGASRSVAGVQLADVKKWCQVFGPRSHPHALEPAPFDKVRLDWTYAYGGAGYAANPLGVGRAKDPSGQVPLPRLELDTSPWRGVDTDQVPVGFGMLDVTHPERQKLVGTYDDQWLKTDFPGMPRDADWRFFQVAPPDQRFEADLLGNETYTLIGLSATERVQYGALPGLKPRLFIERKGLPGLVEVGCKLRTVVFLPDADAVVQVWQGAVKVADEDGSDLSHVVAGLEWLNRAKPVEHYLQTFTQRLDEEDGLLAMLSDEALLPEDIDFESLVPADFDLNPEVPADSLRGRQAKANLERITAARAAVVAQGLDPDAHAPGLPPPPERLPPIRELGAYLRAKSTEALTSMSTAKAKTQQSIDTAAAEFAARGESFDYVLEELKTGPVGPPKPRAPVRIEEMRALQAQFAAAGNKVDEIDDMASNERLHATWHGHDRAAQSLYEQTAHFHAAPLLTTGRTATRQRSWIEQCIAGRKGLAGYDLTGADLRGIDLRGANLDGAMMAAVCMDGVDLSGASARGAVLSHASLVGARADDCDFSNANLGRAVLVGASCRRSRFDGSILQYSDFTDAALGEASFADADLLYIKLAGADLSRAVLMDALLYQTDLSRTKFDGAVIDDTQFFETTMTAASFRSAHAHRTVFLRIKGESLSFDAADLTGARFVLEPSLPRASMREARLTKALLHQADLRGADLSLANLDGCELGRSNLSGANLRGVHAREAGLRFVDLSHAQVIGADLRGALLANANLASANFDATSLYMTDLSRVDIDTRSSFEQVNFGRARIHPRKEQA